MLTPEEESAIDMAVETYYRVARIPIASSAAFGIACGQLMKHIDIDLQTASALIRAALRYEEARKSEIVP